MSKNLDTYIGAGTLFLQRKDIPEAPLLSVGNTPSLKIEWDTDTKKLADYQSPSGGTMDAYTNITGGKLSLEITQFFPENLELLTYGLKVDSAAQTGIKEIETARTGGLLKLGRIPTKESIVVTDETEAITYVAGIDYMPTVSGIRILEGGAIADKSIVVVTYSAKAQYTIETLTQAAVEYRAVIEGLNKAANGQPSVIEIHRIKFGPGGLDVVTDDFRKTSVSGDMMRESSITDSGKSAYCKIQQIA